MLFLCHISSSYKSYLKSKIRCNFSPPDLPQMCTEPVEKYSLGPLDPCNTARMACERGLDLV
jgi:hypothetical protein